MSTSANRQCRRQTEVVEYIDMNSEAIISEIINTTKQGITGELITPWSSGKYCMTKNAAITFTMATAPLPIRLNMPPSPAVNVNVIECFRMSKNPLIAAVQKFSPVSAT